MIYHGTRPTKIDHRDYDFHKTFGTIVPPSFPNEGPQTQSQWMPDQEADGEPYGCTNYAQADLARNLTGMARMPADLEAVTHANALGGYDVRQSMLMAVKIGWFKSFYAVKRTGGLDWFDTFRFAQTSGVPEVRTLTIGTPWFLSWENAARAGQTIMPMPSMAELASVSTLPWHDHEYETWTLKTGQVLYRDKSWQGTGIGEGGYIYFDRATINVVMNIAGTCAFVGTNMDATPVRVDTTFLQWVLSHVWQLLGISY